MKFLSCCSGIEAASVALLPLGWSPFAYAEIGAFPSAVLAHRFPSIPNLGDMTRFRGWPDAAINVFVAGTPCQSFSVAGLRAGLADPRGNLALTYLAIAERYRPDWLVWENVPGILSVNEGRDFASFLGGLGQLGYGWSYRLLDAQFFRVAQRRRRVFVVASARGWASAGAVLFEPSCLRGDPAPSRTAREGSAEAPAGSTPERGDAHSTGMSDFLQIAGAVSAKWRKGTGGPAGDECYNLVPFDTTQVTHPENRSNPQPGDPSPTLAKGGHAPAIAFTCKDFGGDASVELSPTLRAMSAAGASTNANAGGQVAVSMYASSSRGAGIEASEAIDATEIVQPYALKASHYTRGKDGAPSEVCPPLTADADKGDQDPVIHTCVGVRRLTPRECERLQGLPSDWTLVPYRGAPAKDGPRYESIGNSMAVPVMRWIGRRIELVQQVINELAAADGQTPMSRDPGGPQP